MEGGGMGGRGPVRRDGGKLGGVTGEGVMVC